MSEYNQQMAELQRQLRHIDRVWKWYAIGGFICGVVGGGILWVLFTVIL